VTSQAHTSVHGTFPASISEQTALLDALVILKSRFQEMRKSGGDAIGACWLFRVGHRVTRRCSELGITSCAGLQGYFSNFDAANMATTLCKISEGGGLW
jgi:hypothetical protein